MEKKINHNQLKGNYAEHLVSSWLSEKCLVRPVAAGTDIGIDFYCEAIIENQPYKHFWIQVKAIGKDKIFCNNGESMARFQFRIDDLEYWAKQPIPVYVFLVPIEKWPPVEPLQIFCIRMTDYIIRNGIREKKSINITTKDCIEKKRLQKI